MVKEEESALFHAAKLACDGWDENLNELTLVEGLNSELNGFTLPPSMIQKQVSLRCYRNWLGLENYKSKTIEQMWML